MNFFLMANRTDRKVKEIHNTERSVKAILEIIPPKA
jgi:hypothetical protein